MNWCQKFTEAIRAANVPTELDKVYNGSYSTIRVASSTTALRHSPHHPTYACPGKLDVHASQVSEETAQEISPALFSVQFLDKSSEMAAACVIYLKTVFGGVTALAIVIFAVFSIYWGAVWKAPEHTLPGWIVDFDGGAVGQVVSNALSGINPGKNGVSWKIVSASQFPNGFPQLENAIVQEQTWYVLTINRGASSNLTTAVSVGDNSYNSSLAITFIGSEARNENI
ncbi:hypothetical protein FB451DRAFT_1019678 [Mycena latifolia]|nr:hypothetical protein FB451DRAFT_1019678 [Mycena latifolia]